MKYVSCRKNFDDVNEFDPNNTSYFGAPKRFANELILVHGYNTKAYAVQDAYRSNKEIYAEEGGKRIVVGYLWPGLGENWLESLRFHKAQEMAKLSAKYFADYVKTFVDDAPTVVTHSLGAQVVLDAMLLHGAKLKTLILTGPAVEEDALSTKYQMVKHNVDKIIVCWSSHDPVLGKAFKYNQLEAALGCKGPKEPQSWVETFDMSKTVWAHSDYRHKREMWKLIANNS